MHLNDEQLLELDEVGHKHVDQCAICQQKVQNLISIRQQLVALPQSSNMPDRWSDIQKDYADIQQSKQLERTRGQLKRWQLGSFALAASLSAVLLWPGTPSLPPFEQSANSQLTALIEQNNFLQHQLDLKSQNNYLTNVSYKRMQIDINNIDLAIQRAYLKDANIDEKSKLWKTRKQLIRQILSEDNKTRTLRI